MTVPTITKEDIQKLQTFQNTLLRLQTGLARGTATEYLVQQSGQLSVHQLSTYFSILQVHKCKMSRQPASMYNCLFPEGLALEDGRNMRSVTNEHINVCYDLSLTWSSFSTEHVSFIMFFQRI